MTTYMTLIAAIVCVSIPDLTMIMSNVPFFNYMLIFQVPGIDLFRKKVFLPCCTDLSIHPLFFTAGLGSCSIFGIIIFYEMIAKKLYHFLREAVKSTLSVQPVKSERKHKGGRKNAVMNEADYEPDESLEENGSDKEAVFTNMLFNILMSILA